MSMGTEGRTCRRVWWVLVVFFCFAVARNSFPGSPFQPEDWNTRGTRTRILRPTPRQSMADRILARDTLLGMTREQVVEMLGPPSEAGYFREWDLAYNLGPERAGLFRIDSEWLVVRLGRDGVVCCARLVND